MEMDEEELQCMFDHPDTGDPSQNLIAQWQRSGDGLMATKYACFI